MDVHYVAEGRGDTLLLLHGTSSSLQTWDGWSDELKDDFTLIRLDLPGFGLSGPHPNHRYRIRDYVEVLHKFTDSLELNDFIIAGNSLGGTIAWHYALTYPEQLTKMILIAPGGYPADSEASLVFKLARNSLTASFLRHVTPRRFIRKNLKEVYYSDSLISEQLIDRYYELVLRDGNREAFIHRANIQDTSRYDELSSISVPTLIQWGRYDSWISVSLADSFSVHMPGSEIRIYESGHIPMEEIPVETARDAKNFLMAKEDQE